MCFVFYFVYILRKVNKKSRNTIKLLYNVQIVECGALQKHKKIKSIR